MFRSKSIKAAAIVGAIMFAAIGCDDDDNVTTTGPQTGPTQGANIRVIHTSYDAPAVDIAVDGQIAITSLSYGSSSGYASVGAGTRNIMVMPAGASEPVVIDADLTLADNTDYTVIAVDELNSIGAIFYADARTPNPNKAKVRFAHASPDAPAVDIKVGSGSGPAVFANATFRSLTNYSEVDAASYTFAVTAAGSTDEVIRFNPISVDNGTTYTVVAHGTLNDSDEYPFGVRVFVDNGSGDAYVDLTAAPAPVETANVRVIHTSYDAPAVDIAVDGAVAISGLAYGATSGYAAIPAGTRNVAVTPAGATSPVVINVDLPLTANTDYTVLAVDELAMIMPIFDVDARTPNPSMAKVRFVHASPDAPAVDIKVGSGSGPAVFANSSFKDISDYIEVAGGAYTFVVTAAGSEGEVVVFEPVTVMEGNVYTVVAHGTLDGTDMYPFAVRVFVDNGNGDAFVDMTAATASVLAVHASPGTPAVDLLVDNMIAGSGLGFPANTGYLDVAAGTRNIKVNVAGTMVTAIEADLTLAGAADYSVFAIDTGAGLTALAIMDDLTAPAAGTAHVRFIHLSPDAPAVDVALTGGDAVFADYEFSEYSAFTPLPAGTYDLEVRLAGTSTVALPLPGITLEAGMIYTVFARGFAGGDMAAMYPLGAEIIINN